MQQQGGTKFNVHSTKLDEEDPSGARTEGETLSLTPPALSAIFFHGGKTHSGAAFEELNDRIHVYATAKGVSAPVDTTFPIR